MVNDCKSWFLDNKHLFWYTVKFAVGTYKSEFCRVVTLCICELVINWSLFLVINKSNESIYWDWNCRIFNSLNGCWQEMSMQDLCNYVEFDRNQSPCLQGDPVLPGWCWEISDSFCLPVFRYWYASIEKHLILAQCKEQSPSLLLGNGGGHSLSA